MKAVVLADEYRPELREVAMPSPGAGEILIKVAAAGICGSDLAKYRGDLKGVPGRITGHEFSGTIVELGREVKQFKTDDRVAVDPTMSCGCCEFCRGGRPHLCDGYRAVGRHIDGGFAEYCALPALQALPLPDEVSFTEGALIEPLACCLHGLEKARFRAGASAVVIGAGCIGLYFIQLLTYMGARAIVALEPNARRRELAGELGAVALDPADSRHLDGLRDALRADGADLVVEAVGSPRTVERAVALCRKGGTVLLFGVARADHYASLPIFRLYHEEITLVGSFLNPFKQQEALALFAAGRLRVEPFLTRFRLSEFLIAVEEAMQAKCLKAMVEPDPT